MGPADKDEPDRETPQAVFTLDVAQKRSPYRYPERAFTGTPTVAEREKVVELQRQECLRQNSADHSLEFEGCAKCYSKSAAVNEMARRAEKSNSIEQVKHGATTARGPHSYKLRENEQKALSLWLKGATPEN